MEKMSIHAGISMEPLSIEARSERVSENKLKGEDIVRNADKLVESMHAKLGIVSPSAEPSSPLFDNGVRSTKMVDLAPSVGQVASLEEMRKKLEDLDSLRQRMAESNERRHRIAILNDEVIAAEGRVVALVSSLESVTIQLASFQDDVEGLQEREISAKKDLILVKETLPDLVEKVNDLTENENDIRRQLNSAQDALDRSRRVAQETELNIQRILKGTIFDLERGLENKRDSVKERLDATSDDVLDPAILKQQQHEATMRQRMEQWSYRGEFIDTEQQRMELKMEDETADWHQSMRMMDNHKNTEEDMVLDKLPSKAQYSVKNLLGRIEEASPKFYARRTSVHPPSFSSFAQDNNKNNNTGDSNEEEGAVEEEQEEDPFLHQPHDESSLVATTAGLGLSVPNISVDETSSKRRASSVVTMMIAADEHTPKSRSSATREGTPPFSTASSLSVSHEDLRRKQVGAPTARSMSPSDQQQGGFGQLDGAGLKDPTIKRMSLGVAQHNVGRLMEKVAALEKTLSRKEKRILEVEAANAATQDRFTKMRVELLMHRRGMALLGTVEQEGGDGISSSSLTKNDIGASASSGVLGKLREMAANKEKRLTETYELSEKLYSTFMTDGVEEAQGNNNEDEEERTRVHVGPSQTPKKGSCLPNHMCGSSSLHKKSTQYKLLEDLRAEIRFYVAERVSLYSRLYGLKENGGKVGAPSLPSTLMKSNTKRRGSNSKVNSNELLSYGNSLLPPVVPIYLNDNEIPLETPPPYQPSQQRRLSLSSKSPLPAVPVAAAGSAATSALGTAVQSRRGPPITPSRTAMGSIQTEVERELTKAAAPGGQVHQQRTIDALRGQLTRCEDDRQRAIGKYHSLLRRLELVEEEALFGKDSYAQGRSNVEEKIAEVITSAAQAQKELVKKAAERAEEATKAAEEISTLKAQNSNLTQNAKIRDSELTRTKLKLDDALQNVTSLTAQIRAENRKFSPEEFASLDAIIKRVRERDALPSGKTDAIQHRLADACDDLLLELERGRSNEFNIPQIWEQDLSFDRIETRQKSQSMTFSDFSTHRMITKDKQDKRERNISKRRCIYAELAKPIGEAAIVETVQSAILNIASILRGVFKEFVISTPVASKSFASAVQNISVLIEYWEQLPLQLTRAVHQYTEGFHNAVTEELQEVITMITRKAYLDKAAAVSACHMEYRERMEGKIFTDNRACQTMDVTIVDIPQFEVIMEADDMMSGRDSPSTLVAGGNGGEGSQSSRRMSRSASKNNPSRRSSSLVGGSSAAKSFTGRGPSGRGSVASSTTANSNKRSSSFLLNVDEPTKRTPSSRSITANRKSFVSSTNKGSTSVTIPEEDTAGTAATSGGRGDHHTSNVHGVHLSDPFAEASYFDSDEEELYRSQRSTCGPPFGEEDTSYEHVGVGTDMTLEEFECVIAGCQAYQQYQDGRQHMKDTESNTTVTIPPGESDYEVQVRKLEARVEKFKTHLVEVKTQCKNLSAAAEASRRDAITAKEALDDREYDLVVVREQLASLRTAAIVSSVIGGGTSSSLPSTTDSDSKKVEMMIRAFQQQDLVIRELEARIQILLSAMDTTCALGDKTTEDGCSFLQLLQRVVLSQFSDILIFRQQTSVSSARGMTNFRAGSTANILPPRPQSTSGRPSTPSFPFDIPVRNLHSRESGGGGGSASQRRSLNYLSSRPGSSSGGTTSRVGGNAADEGLYRPSTPSIRIGMGANIGSEATVMSSSPPFRSSGSGAGFIGEGGGDFLVVDDVVVEDSFDMPPESNGINYDRDEDDEYGALPHSPTTLLAVDTNNLAVEEITVADILQHLNDENNNISSASVHNDDGNSRLSIVSEPQPPPVAALQSKKNTKHDVMNDSPPLDNELPDKPSSVPLPSTGTAVTSTSSQVNQNERRGNYESGAAGASRRSLLPQQRSYSRSAATSLKSSSSPMALLDEQESARLMDGGVGGTNIFPTTSSHQARSRKSHPSGSISSTSGIPPKLNKQQRNSLTSSSEQQKNNASSSLTSTMVVTRAQLPPLHRSGSLHGVPSSPQFENNDVSSSPAKPKSSGTTTTTPTNFVVKNSPQQQRQHFSTTPTFSTVSVLPHGDMQGTSEGDGSTAPNPLRSSPSSRLHDRSQSSPQRKPSLAGHILLDPHTTTHSTQQDTAATEEERKRENFHIATSVFESALSSAKPSTANSVVRTTTSRNPSITNQHNNGINANGVSAPTRTSSLAHSNGGVPRGRLTVSRQRVSITAEMRLPVQQDGSILNSPTASHNRLTSTTTASSSSSGVRATSPPPPPRVQPVSASIINEQARTASPLGGGPPYTRPVVPEPISPKNGFTLLRGTSMSNRPV